MVASTRPPDSTPDVTPALAEAETLVARGRLLEAIDVLHRANRRRPDDDVECRLAQLRNLAAPLVTPRSAYPDWPVAVPDLDPHEPPCIPVVERDGLTAEKLRRAIVGHGCALVPGLLSTEQAAGIVDDIEHVIQLRADNQHRPYQNQGSWFAALPLPPEEAQVLGRPWIAGGGGLLACDSPMLL